MPKTHQLRPAKIFTKKSKYNIKATYSKSTKAGKLNRSSLARMLKSHRKSNTAYGKAGYRVKLGGVQDLRGNTLYRSN